MLRSLVWQIAHVLLTPLFPPLPSPLLPSLPFPLSSACRSEAFTCWNVASGARVNNYGSRIDLLLAADGGDLTADSLGSWVVAGVSEGTGVMAGCDGGDLTADSLGSWVVAGCRGYGWQAMLCI